MRVEASRTIPHPVSDVWEFVAVHHVENHPRWDPDIRLEQTSEGSLAVGSILRRHSTRLGTVREGTMEIIEFDPPRRMSVLTREGDSTIEGHMVLAAAEGDATLLTLGGEFAGIDAQMAERIRPLLERSLSNIAALMEGEPGRVSSGSSSG